MTIPRKAISNGRLKIIACPAHTSSSSIRYGSEQKEVHLFSLDEIGWATETDLGWIGQMITRHSVYLDLCVPTHLRVYLTTSGVFGALSVHGLRPGWIIRQGQAQLCSGFAQAPVPCRFPCTLNQSNDHRFLFGPRPSIWVQPVIETAAWDPGWSRDLAEKKEGLVRITPKECEHTT